MRLHAGDRRRRNHGIESEFVEAGSRFRTTNSDPAVIDFEKVYLGKREHLRTRRCKERSMSGQREGRRKGEREGMVATGCELIIQFEIFHEKPSLFAESPTATFSNAIAKIKGDRDRRCPRPEPGDSLLDVFIRGNWLSTIDYLDYSYALFVWGKAANCDDTIARIDCSIYGYARKGVCILIETHRVQFYSS